MNIKPCPFCGEQINPESEESWYFFGEGPPPGYTVRCDSCGAQGPYGYGKFRKDHAGGQANAVERWNEAPRPVPASTQETPEAPDNSGVCPVCGWPVGHCNVGCTATSHQRIKIGDRVRLAIGTNTMLPTDGWTVYKLPSHEWRSYGVKHDNGGDMSINAEYVVPV